MARRIESDIFIVSMHQTNFTGWGWSLNEFKSGGLDYFKKENADRKSKDISLDYEQRPKK